METLKSLTYWEIFHNFFVELVTGSYLEIEYYFGNKLIRALLDYADFRASFFKELKNWVKKKLP